MTTIADLCDYPSRESLLAAHPGIDLYEADCINGWGERFETWRTFVENGDDWYEVEYTCVSARQGD